MIIDHNHAPSLQARHERLHHATPEQVNPSREFLTVAALVGLMKHFQVGDDELHGVLQQAALDCVYDDHGSTDDDAALADALMAEWDYSTTPEAAVTYLQTMLTPKQPVNRRVA